jgi:hypothetical protein
MPHPGMVDINVKNQEAERGVVLRPWPGVLLPPSSPELPVK